MNGNDQNWFYLVLVKHFCIRFLKRSWTKLETSKRSWQGEIGWSFFLQQVTYTVNITNISVLSQITFRWFISCFTHVIHCLIILSASAYKLFRSVLLDTLFSAWTGISSGNVITNLPLKLAICNFSIKYFEMILMICALFPVDSIVSFSDGIEALNDRTWLLAMDPVLWALLRPLMEYL